MEGEWPVLLRIMGKGEGDERYLSVAEVRTLFIERRLPERIVARLPRPAAAGCRASQARQSRTRAVASPSSAWPRSWRSPNFPTRSVRSCRRSRNCCRRPAEPRSDQSGVLARPELVHRRTGTGSIMPARAPRPFRCPTTGSSRWNSRDSSVRDNPACSATATISNGSVSCPVRNPSIPTSDLASLRLLPTHPPSRRRRRHHGRRPAADAGREFRRPAGRFRAADRRHQSRHRPGRTRHDRADLRGLSHRKHPLQRRQRALRRRPGHGRSDKSSNARPVCPLLYTLKVPGRFERFAARVLGPNAKSAEHDKLKKHLTATGDLSCSTRTTA